MEKRTTRQNKALHLLYGMLADELNDSGLDMKKVLKPGVDIPWTKESIKEYIWRPIQEAQLNKKSTKDLTTKEIDEVFDTINRHLGEKFGVFVPFPSMDELMRVNNEKANQNA